MNAPNPYVYTKPKRVHEPVTRVAIGKISATERRRRGRGSSHQARSSTVCGGLLVVGGKNPMTKGSNTRERTPTVLLKIGVRDYVEKAIFKKTATRN